MTHFKEYRELPIAPETVPGYLRGFARAVNERYEFIPPPPPPSGFKGYYNPNKAAITAFNKSLGAADEKPDLKAIGARRLSLARLLSDRYLLADLGLTDEDVSELLQLAFEDASTAAIYLEELAARVGRHLNVDARGYYNSSTHTRTVMENNLKQQHGHAYPLLVATVYEDEAYVEVPLHESSHVPRPFIKSKFWNMTDMDLVFQLGRKGTWDEYLTLSCLSERLGVDTASCHVPGLESFNVEEDAEAPPGRASESEQSYKDYAMTALRTPISRIGYVLPIDFREFRHGNLKSTAGLDYEGTRMSRATDRISRLMSYVTSHVTKGGEIVGHRSIIDGRHVTVAHLFDDSNMGLFSYRSEAYGLVSSRTHKHARVDIVCLQGAEVSLARARVVRMNKNMRTFYLQTDARLPAGSSGAVIVDDALRAVGMLDRVISGHEGVYEAVCVSSDTAEFLLDAVDVETLSARPVRNLCAPLYSFDRDNDEFIFEGYNICTPRVQRTAYELHVHGLVEHDSALYASISDVRCVNATRAGLDCEHETRHFSLGAARRENLLRPSLASKRKVGELERYSSGGVVDHSIKPLRARRLTAPRCVRPIARHAALFAAGVIALAGASAAPTTDTTPTSTRMQTTAPRLPVGLICRSGVTDGACDVNGKSDAVAVAIAPSEFGTQASPHTRARSLPMACSRTPTY